jgi:predicted ferric reductase
MTGANHLAWYVARAGGLVTLALLVASAALGIALAARALRSRPGLPWVNEMHRYVSLLTWVFLGVHVGGLLLDSYVGFDLGAVLVPFASSWRPAAVAWGVVAMWLLAAVTVSALVRRRLPRRYRRWWKTVHLASYAVLLLSTVHLFMAGSDARNVVIAGLAGVSLAMTLYGGAWLRLRVTSAAPA